MRIEQLGESQTSSAKRIAATIHWEDSSRPAQQIYFETDHEYAERLQCSPHPFLVAALLPAMGERERRIRVEGQVCPELLEGLWTVMAIMRHWYGPQLKPLQLDVDATYAGPRSPQKYAGSFLSGGVDSLATLRVNKLLFPPEHPRAIRECLIIHGFDMGHTDPTAEQAVFRRAVIAAAKAAADAEVRLIPVITNLRTLNSDLSFWMDKYCGAALASVAHACSGHLASVAIPSSDYLDGPTPYGTHPVLDPNFSSAELQVRHDGIRFSRLDKVRIVAEWPVALDNLRVCTENHPALLNCGQCEKCIRTMTMLIALGKLEETAAFPRAGVTPELLGTVHFRGDYDEQLYGALIPRLNRAGRRDLVAVIEQKSEDFHRYQKWSREEDWKGAVKRLDRRWTGAAAYRLYAFLRRNYHRFLSGH
jgi:hypothetical protein